MSFLRTVRLAGALLVLSFPLLDCATLSKLPGGTCGNGVVDENEDCDSFPATCGKPGSGAGACRIACGAGQPACPDGWGCAVAGFCRQPTGGFGPPGSPGSTGTATMLVGDFDGDGRKDVVGISPRGSGGEAKLRIAYYGEGAALEKVLPLASPVSSIGVRDVDGDGRDDLFAVRAGVDILRGRADRTFLPVLFPTVKGQGNGRQVIVHSTGPILPNGLLYSIFVLSDEGGSIRLNSTDAAAPYVAKINEPYASIAGPPVWATGVDRAVSPPVCGEIYIPINSPSGARVLIVEPCALGGALPSIWAPQLQPTVVPVPVPIVGRVHVADVDGDGKNDIVVGAATGSYVAYQAPLGRFDVPAPVRDLDDGDILDEPPLAVADLNGDGLADFVLPEAILVSFKPPNQLPGRARANYEPAAVSARRWTTAKVGNINADGFVDLVLASGNAPDLDVYIGSANGLLTPFTVPTVGYVSEIEIDDFDGDHIGDVGMVLSRGGRTEIGISYGLSAGAPAAPLVAGELEGVVALETLRDRGSAGQNTLSIWLKETGEGGASTTSVAFLLGSGEREPQAPLLFVDGSSRRPLTNKDYLRQWLPITSVLAPVADAGRADVFSFCLGYTYQKRTGNPLDKHPVGIWASTGEGALRFEPPKEAQPLESATAEDVTATRAVAGDLDPAGVHPRHEIVLIRRSRTGDATLLIYKGEGEPKALPLAGVDIDVSTQLDLLDVDGDGLLDLVAYTGLESSRQTFIGFNDGAGGFALPLTPLPVPADPAHPGEVARSVARVLVSGASASSPGSGARRDLIVLTASRLLLMRAQPNRTFETRDITAASGLAGMSAATGIAVGDFDGDGVEDVAIAEGGTVRILRQIPRLQ